MLFDFSVSNHAHLVGQKNGMTDAIALLYDCERFACEFFPALSTSSLHVYISALLFTPRKTLLHETYGHTLALPIQIYNPPGNIWNLYTQIMYSWLWFTRDRSTNRLEICPRLRPCTGPCSVRSNLGGADVMHSCVLESILTRENPVYPLGLQNPLTTFFNT
jgi:hypothetical protein